MSGPSDPTPSSHQHVAATQGPNFCFGTKDLWSQSCEARSSGGEALALFAPEAILPLTFPACEPLSSWVCARAPDLVSVPNSQRALTTLTVPHTPLCKPRTSQVLLGVCGGKRVGGRCLHYIPDAKQWWWEEGSNEVVFKLCSREAPQGLTFIWAISRLLDNVKIVERIP